MEVKLTKKEMRTIVMSIGLLDHFMVEHGRFMVEHGRFMVEHGQWGDNRKERELQDNVKLYVEAFKICKKLIKIYSNDK